MATVTSPTRPTISNSDTNSSAHCSGSETDLEMVVRLIKLGNPAGIEKLYGMLNGGIRFFVSRSLGIDNADDLVHDVLLAVIKAVQGSTLRYPNALAAYARGVAKNLIVREIRVRASAREIPVDPEALDEICDFGRTPERLAMDQENIEVMRRTLMGLPQRNREILVRFYVRGQSQEQIMSEMDLSPNQFRLAKSRAKARFAALGKRNLIRRKPCRLL